MAQQTAMQELIEYLDPIHSAIKDKAIELLKMEKEQIEQAFKSGLKSPYHQGYTLLTEDGQEETKSKQYYNETYKLWDF